MDTIHCVLFERISESRPFPRKRPQVIWMQTGLWCLFNFINLSSVRRLKGWQRPIVETHLLWCSRVCLSWWMLSWTLWRSWTAALAEGCPLRWCKPSSDDRLDTRTNTEQTGKVLFWCVAIVFPKGVEMGTYALVVVCIYQANKEQERSFEETLQRGMVYGCSLEGSLLILNVVLRLSFAVSE